MGNFKKLAQKRLFLPVFSMILVMLITLGIRIMERRLKRSDRRA